MPWRTPGVGSTDSVENEFIGAGQLYFDPFVSGTTTRTGLRPLGNAIACEIAQNNDVVFRRNFMIPSKPKRLEINRSRDFTVNATLTEYAPTILQYMLTASLSQITQAATPVVDEAVDGMETDPVPGGIIVTAKQGPISAFSMEIGGVAAVLGTDYEGIDATVGLYRILPGTIKTGAVTISYTPTAYVAPAGRFTLNIGNETNIEGRLVIFINPTHGPKKIYTFPRVRVAPNGALGLLSEDLQDIPMSFTTLDASSILAGVPHGTVTYLEEEAS
jgi:hypothetical protein